MTGPLERAAAFFVVPPEASSASATATVPAGTRGVVLGTPHDAPPMAAALALTLRAADRAPAALVAVWRAGGSADPPARGLALPAASRLAARLSRRGLTAAARGRLVWLGLDAESAPATTVVRRAAAAVEGPVVTALAGPRPAGLEGLVDEHDLVIVAADPATPLAEAALAGLSGRCVSAIACRPLPRGLPRALALAGLMAPRLDPPLRAVRPLPATTGVGR